MRTRTLAYSLWVVGAIVMAGGPAWAQEKVAVREIAGAVVVKCTLHGAGVDIPANLLVDLGSQEPLILHSKTAEMLNLGTEKRIDVVFDHGSLSDTRVFAKDLPEVEQLTTAHSVELDELPMVGILGLGAFGKDAVQLDLSAGALQFGSPDGAWRGQGGVALPYSYGARGLLIKGVDGAGKELAVQFGTQRHESLIHLGALERCGLAGGDEANAQVGEIAMGHFTAFRPSPMANMGLPLPDVILGTEFAESFRVTVDPVARRIVLEKVKAPGALADEQRLFLAMHRQSGEGIDAYLAAHGQTLLANEAAGELLGIRLKQAKYDAAGTRRALGYYAESLPASRRSQGLIDLADQLINASDPKWLGLADAALTMAEKDSAEDINALAVHQLHARRGLVALRAGDYVQARRFLLSAAFAMPQDANVNLWLGQLYRQTGQPERAWSRLIQAALAKEPPKQALAELDGLNRDAAFRGRFDVTEAQMMLEGRVPDYAPARQREATELGNLRLVEMFVDIDQPGALGPELGGLGLMRYCAATDAVFVQWHLDGALGNNAAVARAKLYGVEKAPRVMANGKEIGSKPGDEAAAEKLFEEYRAAAGQTGTVPPRLKLDIQAVREGAKITVDVGPVMGTALQKRPESLRVSVLLCERSVFAIGRSRGVFHYNVVRAALTPEGGISLGEVSGGRAWHKDVDLAGVRTELESQWKKLPASPKSPRMEPTLIDPRQCQIVVVVQDSQDRQVWGASVVTPVEKAVHP